MPYLKINYDDAKPTFEELELPEDIRAWLDVCHSELSCCTIQTAPTVLRDIVLVIDEDGKLRDGWQNRLNKVATILYGSNSDFIVGDAILARIDGENLVPLTSIDIDRLRRHFA